LKQKSLAIPIRCVNYSNSSQVVSFFSREAGLVEAIAKGSHREKNAFQGPFDLAVLRQVIFLERPAPALSIVAESEVLDGYRALRRSWARHVAACQVLELLRAVAMLGQPARELFDLAAQTLEQLCAMPLEGLSAGLLGFEVRALRLLGFLGAIDGCILCSRPWPGRRRAAFFSPQAGGLLCRECLGRMQAPAPPAPLPGEAVEYLRGLAAGSNPSPPAPSRLGRPLLRQLHGLLSQSWMILLERPFRMLKYSAVWL
jgi:DNA repair protein RecO (recombination protein O)